MRYNPEHQKKTVYYAPGPFTDRIDIRVDEKSVHEKIGQVTRKPGTNRYPGN